MTLFSKRYVLITALAVIRLCLPDSVDAEVSATWVSDRGDGTYVNPVIHADYSDPDVIRVGDTFYMTASSFQACPGLPILTSKDLVNWTISNYALEQVPPADYYAEPRHGKGVWAPSIRYHDGEYFIYWGDPDFGIFMVKASDPLGKWSDPVLVKTGKGMIDPTPLWDDDGRAYLTFAWAASRSKMNSVITVWEMSPDGTSLTGNPMIVFDGNDGVNHTCEGPKFYKKDDTYYILTPAGGVEKGWQLALRSKSPFGPYESKVVLSTGDSDINGPHQGGLVEAPDGKSWFLHFQDRGLYGRVIHLNPVKWIDGWPVMGNNGIPVRRFEKPVKTDKSEMTSPQESDEFDSVNPGLQWQWHANYNPLFGMGTPMGFMRVYGHGMTPDFKNFWEVPNLFLQKFPAPTFRATAKLKVTAKDDASQSGIIVIGRDYARLAAEKSGETFIIKYITCKEAEAGTAEEVETIATVPPTAIQGAGLYPNYELKIEMRVEVDNDGFCTFSYRTGDDFIKIPRKFKAREGKWIGAKTGVFSVQPSEASRGWADIDWFRLTKNDCYEEKWNTDIIVGRIVSADRVYSDYGFGQRRK